jgi:hypothetical protein
MGLQSRKDTMYTFVPSSTLAVLHGLALVISPPSDICSTHMQQSINVWQQVLSKLHMQPLDKGPCS